MSLLGKLKETDPKRNVLFTAIETLKEELEIELFYEEYVKYLRRHGNENPEMVAKSNIGYALGYYDQKTADRWFKALPGISHPIFGKNIFSVAPEKAFETGLEIAKLIALLRTFSLFSDFP